MIKQVKETHVNRSENYVIFDDKIDIEDSEIETLNDLYKYGLEHYGKCTGKVYIDISDQKAMHIGYIFLKKDKYEDTKESFLRETWLSIEHYKETITRKHFEVK